MIATRTVPIRTALALLLDLTQIPEHLEVYRELIEFYLTKAFAKSEKPDQNPSAEIDRARDLIRDLAMLVPFSNRESIVLLDFMYRILTQAYRESQ